MNDTVNFEGAPAVCPITFSDPETRRCPFPAYRTLRAEHPVYKDPGTGNYVLTRYEDVRRAVLNTKTLSNKTGVIQTRVSSVSEQVNKIFTDTGWVPVDTLVTNDPPSHRQYRVLVDKAFTMDRVASLEPQIQLAVNELIDAFIDKPEIDFFSEFSMRLPIIVFTDILGVTDRDIEKFKRWSDISLESSNPVLAPERELEIVPVVTELQRYLAKNIERVRATPDETLLSTLAHAEVEGRSLTMQELVSILWLLFLAGGETTANSIAAGMKLLVDTPDLVRQLREDPSKLGAFVEETLRVMAPAPVMFRRATADIQIGGVDIPEGSIIETRFGAANLDPEIYQNPEAVDLNRDNPKPHLAFGAGIHLCIGNQLARGELRIAFKTILDRMDNFRAARGEESYEWTSTYVAFGLTKLLMKFDKR